MSQRQPFFHAKPTIAIAFFHRIRRNVQPAGALGGERGASSAAAPGAADVLSGYPRTVINQGGPRRLMSGLP